MKNIVIIILSLTLTGCFCFDRKLQTNILIDETAIDEIDSICLLTEDNSLDSLNFNSTSVSSSENEYRFSTTGRIKLKLKNKNEVVSKSENWRNIKISKFNNKFIFEEIRASESFIMIKFFIVTFMTIFLLKVIVSFLIILPERKLKFIVFFGLLNLLYLTIFEIFDRTIINYIFSFYTIILISDLIFLTIKYGQKGYIRPILAGLISNVLFFTIGQFLITIYVMISN